MSNTEFIIIALALHAAGFVLGMLLILTPYLFRRCYKRPESA